MPGSDQVGNVKPHSLCPLLQTDITIVTNEAQNNKRKKNLIQYNPYFDIDLNGPVCDAKRM